MEAAEPGSASAPAYHNSITTSAPPHSQQRAPDNLHPQPLAAPSRQHQQYRDGPERANHDHPAMATATATILHPAAAAAYPSPTSFSSTYASQSGSTMPLADFRRHDGLEPSESLKRQSLPSLSEVINKNPDYPPPPPLPAAGAAPAPPVEPNNSFPSPYAPSGSLRSYTDTVNTHTSPQNVRSASAYPPRQEPLPSFAKSPRPALSGRPTLPPVSNTRPSPPQYHDPGHTRPNDLPKDPKQQTNGVYSHPQPPVPPHHTSAIYPPGPRPAGQLPLPPFPTSPRQMHTAFEPYEHRRQTGHHGHARGSRADFEGAPYSDTINYREGLTRMANHAKVISNFAEAYTRIAREEHGHQPMPERMPSEEEINELYGYVDAIKSDLESVKQIMQNAVRSREQPPRAAFAEDRDGVPYDENVKFNHQSVLPEKRKRGRTAPPGRCHSCNRVDTPEWRRGPDGARTLCNACGLHYAKLERKRAIEERTMRATMEAGK